MKVDSVIRGLLAFFIVAVFLMAVGALLFVAESALNVWDRLLEGPRLLLYLYVALLAGFALATIYLIVRLVIRRKPKKEPTAVRLDRDSIEARLREADAAGVDVEQAQRELAELASRQLGARIHLCFFGEISKGKSSLVRALIPDAAVEVDVVGGSTADVRHYRWENEAGTEVLLTDVPGIGGHDDGLDDAALAEARRAHIVMFIADGDLNRNELRAVEQLLASDKPLVLVMNKADRFNHDDRATLMERLLQRVEDLGGDLDRDRVVAVSAGGEVDVVERDADGNERTVRRQRDADVGVLVVAVNRLLDDQLADLDRRRDQAVFQLASERLDAAQSKYREQRAEQIIRSSTRKAVVGALAAVSPGTDVIIQGYIGTSMTQQLCGLYDAAPRDLDIEQFLNLSQSRAGKAIPLALAVAGNGLKAFPGIGTVAGGLAHAVAYGLIFDALGRSLVQTLKTHGKLVPEEAAQQFEEGVSEYLEAGAKRVARLALDARRKDD